MKPASRQTHAQRLQEILSALQGARGAMRLHRYRHNPVRHQKQDQFHACQKRNRWVFGGNRTGKTECGAVEAIYFARGNHPHRNIQTATVGWVVSPTHEVQRDVAQRKILQYLDPSWVVRVVMRKGSSGDMAGGIIDYLLIKSLHGAVSYIGFKSCDQGREKFQGASLDWVWFDEEPPEDIYRECSMRLLDKAGNMWGTMTPLKGMTWVYDQIYLNKSEDEQTWHIRMSWEDNPFLPKDEVQRLDGMLSCAERASRKDGLFGSGGGLVYPEFDEFVHVIPPFAVPPAWMDKIAIDPGLVNPLAALWCACDEEGTVYIVAEHYQSGRMVEEHAAAILQISKNLGWPTDAKGRVRAIFDPAVKQRTLANERSAAELFYDHGILPDCRVNKDVMTGIQRVRERLLLRKAWDEKRFPHGKPRLFIFDTCVNTLREMRTYRFVEGSEQVDKKNDHAMDALRYYIMSRPEPPKTPAPPISPITRDKQRLLRALGRK